MSIARNREQREGNDENSPPLPGTMLLMLLRHSTLRLSILVVRASVDPGIDGSSCTVGEENQNEESRRERKRSEANSRESLRIQTRKRIDHRDEPSP